jgi:hypothetical protein
MICVEKRKVSLMGEIIIIIKFESIKAVLLISKFRPSKN